MANMIIGALAMLIGVLAGAAINDAAHKKG